VRESYGHRTWASAEAEVRLVEWQVSSLEGFPGGMRLLAGFGLATMLALGLPASAHASDESACAANPTNAN
jgi:hypothetical protein